MNQETEKNFNEYLKAVPNELRDAIIGSRWEEKLISIGRRNGVHIDQLGMLQDELAFVMGGVSSRDEFRSNLVDHLNLRDAEADAIIADINKNIMSDIQARLKRNIEEIERREQEDEANQVLLEHGIEIDNEDNSSPQSKSEKPITPTQPTQAKVRQSLETMQKFTQPFTLQSLVKKQIEEQKPKDSTVSENKTELKHADPYREPIS